MVFAGPAALTQYSHDGSSFAFTRTDALPAIPRECYDTPMITTKASPAAPVEGSKIRKRRG